VLSFCANRRLLVNALYHSILLNRVRRGGRAKFRTFYESSAIGMKPRPAQMLSSGIRAKLSHLSSRLSLLGSKVFARGKVWIRCNGSGSELMARANTRCLRNDGDPQSDKCVYPRNGCGSVPDQGMARPRSFEGITLTISTDRRRTGFSLRTNSGRPLCLGHYGKNGTRRVGVRCGKVACWSHRSPTTASRP
jgi:hypothetical protein